MFLGQKAKKEVKKLCVSLKSSIFAVGRQLLPSRTARGISFSTKKCRLEDWRAVRYEWKNVFVDARYHFGFGDVLKSANAKNRFLSVNLGYRFEI